VPQVVEDAYLTAYVCTPENLPIKLAVERQSDVILNAAQAAAARAANGGVTVVDGDDDGAGDVDENGQRRFRATSRRISTYEDENILDHARIWTECPQSKSVDSIDADERGLFACRIAQLNGRAASMFGKTEEKRHLLITSRKLYTFEPEEYMV
jgi:hypothetical protein